MSRFRRFFCWRCGWVYTTTDRVPWWRVQTCQWCIDERKAAR